MPNDTSLSINEEVELGDEARGVLLDKYRKELLRLAESATSHFFKMGQIMKNIRDNELWRESYESFASFYSDPEFDFKKSSVYHSIRLVEMFPEWDKFIDISEGKLIMIAPYVNDENRNELINQARTLSRGDLFHQLRVMTIETKLPQFAPLPKIYHCQLCGKIKGIRLEEVCHCGEVAV